MKRKRRRAPQAGPTTIYLIRHAETDINLRGICQSQTVDSKLSRRGVEQAKKLAKWAQDEDIAAVYSSPLCRAVRTAEIAFGGKKIIEIDELMEQHCGALSGKTVDEMLEILAREGIVGPKERPNRKNPWHMLRYGDRFGGESDSEVFERGMRAIKRIAKRHPGKKVAVVAHGRLNRLLLCGFAGRELDSRNYGEITQSNACINVLKAHGGKVRVAGINRTDHLKPESRGNKKRRARR